jgi:hypothetical protein
MTKHLAALDVGNANTKLKLSLLPGIEETIAIPSNLTLLDDADDQPDAYSYVGNNPEWCPKFWMQASGGNWVMDYSDGKPKLCLPLFLTALYPHVDDGDEIDLVVSVHNVDALGDRMVQALSGTHIFQRSQGSAKLIKVNVVKVLSEGVGAILSTKPKTPKNFLLDIGGDTVIGTPYLGLRIAPGCNPYPLAGNGTRRLISEFSKCQQVSKTLNTGRVLSYEASRSVIDNPHHLLTVGKTKHSMKDAVKAETDRWLDDVVLKVERMAGHHLLECDGKIATGGGCLIPEVAAKLKGMGYVLAPSPLTANVEGMLAWIQKAVR